MRVTCGVFVNGEIAYIYSLTFTLPEVFYDVMMAYTIQINDVILWGLRRPHW